MLQAYRSLFAPYENKGLISFCLWNESGKDIESALPDLAEIIEDKPEWRAIVVVTPHDKSELMHQNPFDYVGANQNRVVLQESEHAVIRLSHMLLGFPALGTKAFEESISYVDELSGEKIIRPVNALSAEQIKELANNDQTSFKKVFTEVNYSEKEILAYNKVAQKYSGFEDRPQEVLMTTIRLLGEDYTKVQLVNAWQDKLESQSSGFWKRNNYSSGTRFLCYEVTKTDYVSQEKEMFEFCVCILCLAINRINPSTLQAYRLYDMRVNWDEAVFGEVINRHLNELNAIDDAISERLDRTQINYDNKKTDLLFSQDVQIVLENDDVNSLLMNDFKLNFASDYPFDEKVRWIEQVHNKKKAIDSFLKQPRRAVSRAIVEMRNKLNSYKFLDKELSLYQIEDLNDYMRDLKSDMTVMNTESILDREKFENSMERQSKKVQRIMNSRLTVKKILLAFGLAFIVLLVGYFPFLFFSFKESSIIFSQSIIIVFLAAIFMTLAGFIALFGLRQALYKQIERYNNSIRKVVSRMKKDLVAYQNYLSCLTNYMKAKALINSVAKREANKTNLTELLYLHKRWIDKTKKKVERWRIAFGVARKEEHLQNSTLFFEAEREPAENPLYQLETPCGEHYIPINSSGDVIVAPYKYIKQFNVQRINIYDELERTENLV